MEENCWENIEKDGLVADVLAQQGAKGTEIEVIVSIGFSEVMNPVDLCNYVDSVLKELKFPLVYTVHYQLKPRFKGEL